MTVRYDTSCEPAGRRLALWQDIVCDVFVQLDCKSDLANFHGSVAQSRFGEMSLTRVESSRQRVFRTRSRIARAKEDYHCSPSAFTASAVSFRMAAKH